MTIHSDPTRRTPFAKTILLIMAGALVFGTPAESAAKDKMDSFIDDSQAWPALSLKLVNKKPWSLTTYVESRFADEDNPQRLWLISERIGYAALSNLMLGVNYTFLHYRVPAVAPVQGQPEEPWISQHRLEFEANPHWGNAHVKIALRNRFEIRWTEDASEENYRSRHRLEVTFPISKTGLLESVLISDEPFYDYSAGEFNENRFIPLGVNWRLAEEVTLRIYYMERSVKAHDEWTTTHVLGTTLFVNF
jgi:hypothetical protein